MKLEATPRNAALTGVWSATGLSIFEIWINGQTIEPGAKNLLWIIVAVIFFFVPVVVFVFGLWWRRVKFSDQFTREYWVEFGKVGVRMLCWFLSAGATGMVIAALERAVSAI